MDDFQEFEVTATGPEEIINRCCSIMGQFDQTIGHRLTLTLEVDNLLTHQRDTLKIPEFHSYGDFEDKCHWLETKLHNAIINQCQGCCCIISAKLEVHVIGARCIFCNGIYEDMDAHIIVCKGKTCYKCLKPLEEGDHEFCNMLTYQCEKCGHNFTTAFQRSTHVKNCAGQFELAQTAINDRFQVFRLNLNARTSDYEGCLRSNIERIVTCIRNYSVNTYPCFKFAICVHLLISKYIHGDERSHYISSGMITALADMDLNELARIQVERVIEEIFSKSILQSGWIVKAIDYIDVNISKYSPTGPASYLPLPSDLLGKRGILNPCNPNDEKCFLWAVLMEIFPVTRNRTRVAQYSEHENKIDMNGVCFPVKVEKINRIEEANNLIINVFKFDDDHGILPVRASPKMEGREINLLLIQDDEKSHYALITNKSAFFNEVEGGNNRNHSYWCARCIKSFKYENKYQNHIKECSFLRPQKVEMPKHDFMKFTDFGNTIPAPCYVVCDFETLQVPEENGPLTSAKVSTVAKCVPISFCYKVCSDYEQYDEDPIVVVVSEDNAGAKFVEHMNATYERLRPLINSDVAMIPLNPEQILYHESVPDCHICHEKFLPGQIRHHDHCHYPLKPGKTSNYIGPAHFYCNTRRRISKRLPVIFHYLSGFDLHLFFKDLCKSVPNLDQVGIIKKSGENYLSVKTKEFQFVDSYKHLLGKLADMASKIPPSKMDNLKSFCENKFPGEPQKFDMLRRKLVFPYNYLQHAERLDHPIPDRCWFQSLEGKDINDKDWNFLQNLLQEFNIQKLRELLILYNTVDVLLLADVWAVYRRRCLDDFQLEPSKYIGCPSLSFDAALKLSREKLTLIKDPEIYNFWEKGVRGGISVINTRESSANNEYVGLDPDKPESFIAFLDSVNLYGRGMMCKLPYSDFRFIESEKFTVEKIMSLDADADIGYAFEVDLGIPTRFHEELNDYPIAPSKLEINESLISHYSKRLRDMCELPERFKAVKFAPNLFDKEEYITMLGNLQFYLSKGANILRIHRVMCFKQKAWMKEYIEMLTQRRRAATCESEKYRYKTASNACFGKFLQNCRNYIDVKLVNTPNQHKVYTTRSEFKDFQIFTEDLAIVDLRQKVVTLNRPVYCGFAILEASKKVMFDFWYNVIRKKWTGAELLFTDTDSFLLKVYTRTFYKDVKQIAEHFDLSNLPPHHPLFSEVNKFVPGKFKFEVKDKFISEFIGLRSKMYSIKLADGKQKSAAAGVKKAVSEDITHQMYKNCLHKMTKQVAHQKHFRSHKHDMFLIDIQKTSLCPYDDKRHILNDGVHTKAYGHVDVEFSHDNL